MTKKFVAAAVGTLIIAGSSLQVPLYKVTRVIDGDTFETAEKQLIRLDDVDAPELEYCGGPESKAALEKMILGKYVYLKVNYRDPFKRLDSYVYNTKGSVNAQMIKTGNGVYRSRRAEKLPGLDIANNYAREKKLGVFSEKCTQLSNPDKPKCVIKANNRSGVKYYSFPGCATYNSSIVQLHVGDQWFCSETEARAAGYTKGSDCFDKKWVN